MAAGAMQFLEKALERLWFGCGGHCHTHGDGGASCPLLDGADPAQLLSDPEARRYAHGAGLVGAAAAVFLLPLVATAGGAFVAGRYLAGVLPGTTGTRQLIGMFVGLAAGVALARLVLRARPKRTSSGGGEE